MTLGSHPCPILRFFYLPYADIQYRGFNDSPPPAFIHPACLFFPFVS
jgi:hypothetical protein